MGDNSSKNKNDSTEWSVEEEETLSKKTSAVSIEKVEIENVEIEKTEKAATVKLEEAAHEIDAADLKDFRAIYNEAFDVVFKVVFRLVGEDEVAEDIVHDSLITMNEKGVRFPDMDGAKFWLIRVGKNAALNYIRRKGREKIAYEKILYGEEQTTESVEKQYFKKVTQKQVNAALEKLPLNMREVLVLREYGNLKYDELARVLAVSEANAKIRVFRARTRFAKLIGVENVTE
ncbi:MAG: hypothetical protein Ta2A_04810 [Treponemataceae bacterium]|nr:MAG: hypothetical protein Ta2A_04810 [Treponemataceae bacterium]